MPHSSVTRVFISCLLDESASHAQLEISTYNEFSTLNIGF